MKFNQIGLVTSLILCAALMEVKVVKAEAKIEQINALQLRVERSGTM